MRLIAETIQSVVPHSSSPWERRIVLGCWALKYIPHCEKYLPAFPITYIGFSTRYARQFFPIANVSFNMLLASLMMPVLGRRFIRDARERHRPVYAWTVNNDDKMRWCIEEGLDGVITDDPKREIRIPMKERVMSGWFQLMVLLFEFIFWMRYGWKSTAMRKKCEPIESKRRGS